MFSYENDIYIATGKNLVLELDEDYNWKTLELDDKYNQQNNKFMRVTKKVVYYNNKLYCLSEAWDVKSIDTINGVISTRIDTKYNELISIDGNILKKEFSETTDDVGCFFDMVTDGNSLWISSSNLIRYENGEIKEEIDVYNTLDFDPNLILSHLVVDKEYVYMLKQYTIGGTKDIYSYLIRYEKSTGKLEKFEFPGVKSHSDGQSLRKPTGFTNMIIENDIIYISSGIGLYKFNNNTLTYVDIFSEFLDEIPTVFFNYLNSENVSIVNGTMFISTNVGLIYSDDFISTSDVNIANANVGLDIYPNVLTKGQNSITIESSNINNVNGVIIYNLEGAAVYKYNTTLNPSVGILKLEIPYLTSGNYFIAVLTKKDNYISPLIIQN